MKLKTALLYIAGPVLLAFVCYLLFLNHVGANHVGIAFNSGNGDLYLQERSGWYVTSPLVRVAEVSTLPEVVELVTQAKIVRQKVVKLRADKLIEFVRLQGFSYSLSMAQNNIMMGYAFSGQEFSFLEVVQQGGIENAPVGK